MKKLNIFISLLTIFTAISIIDIRGASKHVGEVEKRSEKEEKISQEEADKLLLDGIITGNIAAVEKAIEMGADFNCKTPAKESEDTFKVRSPGQTALCLASMNGHTDIVKLLLESQTKFKKRINIDENALDGTALYHASRNGYVKIVTLLLKHKADVELKCRTGNNALTIACEKGRFDIVSLLLQYKADVYSKTASGNVALEIACENGRVDVVELLLQYGANHTTINSAFIAVSRAFEPSDRYIKILNLLVQYGADVNTQDICGDTPLILALSRGSTDLVKLLLQYGADVNIRNNAGKTALNYIIGKPELEQILSDHKKTISNQLDETEFFVKWIPGLIEEYLLIPKDKSKEDLAENKDSADDDSKK